MKDFQEKLQGLGLAGREAEVYLALLKKKELTAAEISKITTITRTKSYEVLQNLVKKGVCNERNKNGRKLFSSVEPTIAIQNMLSVYEEELNRKKLLAEQFREDLVALHKIKENNSYTLDYIEVLTDVKQIRERWLDFQKNTKKEMLVFVKPPYTSPAIETNIQAESELLKKNKIIIKGIYEYENLTSEEINSLIRIIESYQKIGEDARIIKELPMKLAIYDETITMLALNDKISLKPSITTIIVDHQSFAKAQKEVFETYWAKSIPIEDFKRNLNNKIEEKK